MSDPDIAIIGGGPAGLAAAEVLVGAGLAVTIYERMPSLGRKFLMAGRGGLNLTHSEPLPAFQARYHPAEARLAGAVEAFPPDALRAWCEALGEPSFVGSSGRVFPKSFKASPLLRAWLTRLDGLGVRVRTRHRFVGWDEERPAFETPAGRISVPARATLLALGGASWSRLGSDGAWVPLLREAGVPVSPLAPANGGFAMAWSDFFRARFAGAPLKRIALTIGDTRVRGEAVVTGEGIEGGAIYAASRLIREAMAARGEAVIALDLRPDLTEAALAGRLAAARPGQSQAETLRKQAGLSPVMVSLLRESAGRTLPSAAPDLAALIKAAPLRINGTGSIERAISTAGGVAFAGLDARFMLRARPGTFVAGEMLDWEAPTGGYLLQAAFATGRAAAEGMMAWLQADAEQTSSDRRGAAALSGTPV
ncbi:TIGR03862 family flavoprotein [Methylobacterium iners]|uniref:3-dehydro-bile acid delta(4,6)-reductase n=1 Tax=Methylobacterium iners TaxID=418707 RepID=A0ABQ4S183_9HYPH|nr:TIGR03862 family flavoprotein [Methylobacterium iners]GJD96202.1 3-dehydro-bile acid delta(4,6)-reductase [Methylobacterium iners]